MPSAPLESVGPGFVEFWRERHLATLSTVRADGTVHVIPVGVTLDLDAGRAWVITSGTSAKARLIARAGALGAAVAVCQVDGARWSTLEARAFVRDDAEAVDAAVARYAERYRPPRENPRRVALELVVTRILGNV